MSRQAGGLAAVIAASIAAFLLADAYAACLLSLDGNPIENLSAALGALPSYVAANGPFSPRPAPLATGMLGACAVMTAWAYALSHGKPERAGEEHGSARWGTRREGRKFMNERDFSDNIIFTEHYVLNVTL